MVSLSILGVISAIFVLLMGNFRTTSEGAAKRLEDRAIHRTVQKRVRLVLRAAMQPNEVDPAVSYPAIGDTDSEVRFHAPSNLLDETIVFDPRSPDYPEFTIKLVGDRVSLQRSDGTGPEQQFGRQISSLDFFRESEKTVKIDLETSSVVRGASGGRKPVLETSSNRILTH